MKLLNSGEISMKALVKFQWDCGRQGYVNGLFIVEKEELEAIYGKTVYFGEILGKHSEIYGKIEPQDFTILTEDQDYINKTIDLIGWHLSGYTPFDYLPEEE